jgi:hypothetical protein
VPGIACEPCPEHTTRKDCRNCLHYAVEWGEQVRATAGWNRGRPGVAAHPADAPTALVLF